MIRTISNLELMLIHLSTSLERILKGKKWSLKSVSKGFPDGAVVKNPPASGGDTGSSPGLGRSHMPRSN